MLGMRRGELDKHMLGCVRWPETSESVYGEKRVGGRNLWSYSMKDCQERGRGSQTTNYTSTTFLVVCPIFPIT